MKINLVIPGIPQPKQSARFRAVKNGNKSFVKSYQKKEVKENERNIKYEIRSQLPVGFIPFQNGIKVNKLHYIFPPLKGFSKKKMQEIVDGAIIYKDTKPDLTDNLQKGLFDAMEGLVFLNDSQVCELNNVKKYYGFQPRIEIELEEVN